MKFSRNQVTHTGKRAPYTVANLTNFCLIQKFSVKFFWSVFKGNFRYKITKFGQNDLDLRIPGSLKCKIATLEVNFDALKALQEGMKQVHKTVKYEDLPRHKSCQII